MKLTLAAVAFAALWVAAAVLTERHASPEAEAVRHAKCWPLMANCHESFDV